MISKQIIAITYRCRIVGGRKGRSGGRDRRKKLKAFWPPQQSLDGYTACIRVPLAPRQRPRHCFCQPQTDPFEQETGTITPISPG